MVHQFELQSYKFGNKIHQLIIELAGKDYCGWHDYYTVKFKVNGRTKTSFRGKRFTLTFGDESCQGFMRYLSPHSKLLLAWNDFHYTKANILGFKYLNKES